MSVSMAGLCYAKMESILLSKDRLQNLISMEMQVRYICFVHRKTTEMSDVGHFLQTIFKDSFFYSHLKWAHIPSVSVVSVLGATKSCNYLNYDNLFLITLYFY